jgi:hypothetical protein
MPHSEAIAHLIPGLRRYIEDHIETGSFLRAVLSNDLREACARYVGTDWVMSDLVNYIELNAPEACWGSPEKVMHWLSLRKLAAEMKAEAQDPDSITSLLLRNGAFQDEE